MAAFDEGPRAMRVLLEELFLRGLASAHLAKTPEISPSARNATMPGPGFLSATTGPL